ncbi:MAG: hypothetical protein AAGD38_21405 [Acidobacteriota bacterium]
MEVIGIAFFGLGMLVSMGAGLWYLLVSFREAGAITLLTLVPIIGFFVGIYILINHWEALKKPFLVQIGGTTLMLLAVLATPGAISGVGGSDGGDYDYAYDYGSGSGGGGGDYSYDYDSIAGQESDELAERERQLELLKREKEQRAREKNAVRRRDTRRDRSERPKRRVYQADSADQLIGRRVRIVTTEGNTVIARVKAVDGDTITIQENLGGGVIAYPIERDRIKELLVLQ